MVCFMMIDIFCWAKIRKGNRVAKDRMEKMAVGWDKHDV